jgi:hypothetical protein
MHYLNVVLHSSKESPIIHKNNNTTTTNNNNNNNNNNKVVYRTAKSTITRFKLWLLLYEIKSNLLIWIRPVCPGVDNS